MLHAGSNRTDPTSPASRALGWLRHLARRLRRSEGASIAPMFALLLIPISGSIAFAVELGGFYYVQRSAQNAADAAAIAAATNNKTSGTTYLMEARAATRPYGYVDGQDNTTVTAAPVTCPTGATGTSCYRATVSTVFPISFARLIGFTGDTAVGTGRGQLIGATAIATTVGGGTGTTQTSPCYWALSTDPSALTGHGIPFANLTGCSVFSNGGIDCTGHDMGADYAIAALSTARPDCARPLATPDTRTGPVDQYGASLPSNPYAVAPYTTLATAAAANACSSSPPTNGVTSATLLVYCGDLAIGANKTLTLNSPNTVVVIKNGSLDMSAVGSKIVTATGASATIVFAGTQAPFGDKNIKGTIDIKAPDKNSGSPWKGVAIYRAPSNPITTAVLAGQNATWNLTGAVYLPLVDVTIDGVVNKATGGSTCFMLMANIITINGNGTILNTLGGCDAAGAPPITTTVGTSTREKLVF